MARKEFRNGKKKPWLVRWGSGNTRHSKAFTTEKQADLYIAREFEKEKKEMPAGFVISPHERALILRMRKNGDMTKQERFLEDNYKAVRSDLTLKEAQRKFIQHRKDKNLRAASIYMYEHAFEQTAGILEKKKVDEFMPNDVAEILAATYQGKDGKPLKYAHSCLDKILLAYKILFNWLMREGFCSANPFAEYRGLERIVDKKDIRILTAAQTKEFLGALPDKLQPAFALMAFAGVRPGEMHNTFKKDILRWEDIDFNNKRINIRSEVAKGRKRRIIHGLPPNIWEWLNLCKDKTGPIVPITSGRVDKNRQNVCKKIGLVWGEDILRHSFGSYGYYKIGAELTVDNMGHTNGFDVFVKHYKGLANKAEAEKYFKILPA